MRISLPVTQQNFDYLGDGLLVGGPPGAAGAGWTLWRFQATVLQGVHDATRFASDISACNLATSVRTDYPQPLGALMQRLQQTQVNLRAVVGGVVSVSVQFRNPSPNKPLATTT